MVVSELAYDAAVKYFLTIPTDCAEYKAAKTMQASHDIWKRAAMDSIKLCEKLNDKLDKLSLIPEIAQKL